ncbi:MAG: hypothetical protein ACI8PZ_003277 [Myxococcota bacterium]|jgi:hypothetical protein
MTYTQTDALPTAATYSHLTTLKAEASRTADALRTLACVATDGPLSDAAEEAAARCEAIHPALDDAAASLDAGALPDPVSPPVPDRYVDHDARRAHVGARRLAMVEGDLRAASAWLPSPESAAVLREHADGLADAREILETLRSTLARPRPADGSSVSPRRLEGPQSRTLFRMRMGPVGR